MLFINVYLLVLASTEGFLTPSFPLHFIVAFSYKEELLFSPFIHLFTFALLKWAHGAIPVFMNLISQLVVFPDVLSLPHLFPLPIHLFYPLKIQSPLTVQKYSVLARKEQIPTSALRRRRERSERLGIFRKHHQALGKLGLVPECLGARLLTPFSSSTSLSLSLSLWAGVGGWGVATKLCGFLGGGHLYVPVSPSSVCGCGTVGASTRGTKFMSFLGECSKAILDPSCWLSLPKDLIQVRFNPLVSCSSLP